MKHCGLWIAGIILCMMQTVQANTFKTEKWQTKNGASVIFYQAKEVPMLDISVAFAAGSAYDGSHYGLSALTLQMLNQGNAGLDATTLGQALADTGAQFDSDISKDMVVLNLRSLSDKKVLPQAVAIFNKILNHPDFPDTVFEHEKKQQIMAIEHAFESPEEIANMEFFKALYPEHPYGHPVNGAKATVGALHKKDIIDFYKHYYVARNATVVIVGAIDSKEAHAIANKLTEELPKGLPAQAIPLANPLKNPENMHIKFPSYQTVIRLGEIGINHQNPHYFPLIVGNYILGGGSMVSQLGTQVREKRGLTYGISSQFFPMPGNGPFIINLSTKNNQTNDALRVIHETFDQFIQNGPTEQELEAAKSYLTGSFPLSLGSNRAIANLLLRMAFYHLPDDYLDTYVARIKAVTLEDIKQSFKNQIDSASLLLVTVGAA